MTHEPPDGGPAADVQARLAAVLAEVEAGNAPARTAITEPDQKPAPRAPVPVAASTGSTPGTTPDSNPGTSAEPGMSPRPGRRRSIPRRVAFATVLVLLIAAIPTLGYLGAHTLRESRAGQVLNPVTDPRAPGYTAIVASTPTAFVIQRDAYDLPVALTVIGLGAGQGGGSVLFVPLDTLLPEPFVFTPDRLRLVHEVSGDRALVDATAGLLNIALASVIELSDDDWSHLVGPVAPLSIDNPDSLDAFPAGRLTLSAEQVGPYLAAQGDGESDLNRLIRHQVLWQAWLAAIAESTAAEPVPEGPDDILGPIARTLAGGIATIDTLDVDEAPPRADGAQLFTPDMAGVREQVTDAVPYPVAPTVGSRYSVRLLNGVDGNPIPEGILRRLVLGDAQIGQIGNAKRFGAAETRIEYHDPRLKDRAGQVVLLLGGGKPVLNTKSNEAVDLIVTLGRDAMEAAAAESSGGGGGN